MKGESKIIDDRGPLDHEELHMAEAFMYKDKPLTPRMIASLMKVDSSLPHYTDATKREQTNSVYSVLYAIGVGVAAIIVAIGIGVLFLYTHEIGPFHSVVAGVGAGG